MSTIEKFPTIAEELKAFSPGIVILGAYYALEFGSLQGLYPLMGALKLPTITAMSALGYALWLLLNGRVKFDKITICYAMFILYLVTNAHYLTVSPENREAAVKLFILYFAYFIIGSTVVRRLDSFILLLDILLACMAYSCLHGMLQGGLLWGSQWLSDENIYAVFCCTGIPFAYVLLMQDPSKIKKICYGICLGLYVIGVALAASRGGFLAFGIIVCIFWFFSKKKIKAFLFLLVLGLGVLTVIPPKVWHELEQIDVDEQEGSAGERVYLWRLAGDMFRDHKVYGVGVTNYGEFYFVYDQTEEARDKFGGINWRGQQMVAHSTPMTFLAETGVVGIFLLILLLAGISHQLAYVIRAVDMQLCRMLGVAAATAMLSFWVGSLFLSLVLYPFFYNLLLISSIVFRLGNSFSSLK